MADHSVNLAECIKSAAHFGFTRYHNICAGTVTDMPWGAVDFVAFGALGIFFFGISAVFLALFFVMIREW